MIRSIHLELFSRSLAYKETRYLNALGSFVDDSSATHTAETRYKIPSKRVEAMAATGDPELKDRSRELRKDVVI